MAFDAQLLLRDGSADMTATLTGTYVAIPPQADGDLALRISVPSLAETGDKIAPVVTFSNDGTNALETITMPDITKANVDLGKTEYYCRILPNRAYVKITLTATDSDSGSDFNAGKVVVGIVPAGRHQVF